MQSHLRFRPYDRNQLLLLPPDVQDWVAHDDLARFICSVVDQLDLTSFYAAYDSSSGGRPAYHPRMMVSLLLYGYCIGVRSSRQLEAATYDRMSFRYVTANQHPDHDTIAAFRARHRADFERLFVTVLDVCVESGMKRVGVVAIDGTRLRANAAKSRTKTRDQLARYLVHLKKLVESILRDAAHQDRLDADSVKDQTRTGTVLDEKKLGQARARIAEVEEAMRMLEDEQNSPRRPTPPSSSAPGKKRGRPPKPGAKPRPPREAKRNLTDPDSRVMRDSITGGWVQAYNAQAAVDAESHLILAADVCADANDKKRFVPMLTQTRENCSDTPSAVCADSGYFSATNVTTVEQQQQPIDVYIPPPENRIGHVKGDPDTPNAAGRMRIKGDTDEGKRLATLRKTSVEPVFGFIKQTRGIRQTLFRGMDKVRAEWRLVCLTHNLLKLWRFTMSEAEAAGT